MTGSRQQKPRIGLTKCPDLVDHYRVIILAAKKGAPDTAADYMVIGRIGEADLT